ncbi:bifunctional DNA-formamidopyrimidine glycosylase/DNA-(apurinic or apyrimidinic site) lyase [Candidatus Saccharibacteria bacterium]|nr:bifunctional DNA-formamidopyrimidine glycosylase/DNA-(apurinic or apyrimidinic site) lyase [Candidatus Saccharibacteria bacterium]MCL1963429.1 bifunctional DNA-formamidopyrimidine glycosylase/DNA-(apurinic or apyrimidinic site) lyase [Candidatus Saccharibacteria bacterium]
MPELPEVETVRRGLENLIVGRKILNVDILNPKSFLVSASEIEEFVVDAEIIAVRRRAKVLIIDLSSNYSLVIHLKMTGQIVFRGSENWGGGHPNDSFVGDLPDRSTRVEFELNGSADGLSKLFFNDQRKFGWIKLIPTLAVEKMEFIAKLGPEPLIGNPETEFLTRVRRRNNSAVKAAILDQSVIAGIGNIYADEALWGAKIHPATRVRDISDEQLREILQSAIDAMNKSLSAGGSTMKTYVNADGKKGNYLDLFANVFRRDGASCPRCGAIITKIRIAGRGTHVCLKCQKLRAKSQ